MSAVPIAATLSCTALCWLLCAWALSRWAYRASEGDERHAVTTQDGWTLNLHRFLPSGSSASRHPIPVIFGHGLCMNRAEWELGPNASLPRFLADRGHDVWVAEYRGTRSSTVPPGSTDRWNYQLEDHADLDLPAIIEGVCVQTESDKVSWVGHSMGGIVLYLHASEAGSKRLHRVVTLGSPVHFGLLLGLPGALMRAADRLLRSRKRLFLRALLFVSLPAVFCFPRLFTGQVLNPRHLSRRSILTLLWTAFEDVSSRLFRSFTQLNLNRTELCPGPQEDVAGIRVGGLAQLIAPTLVLSATRDFVAPPGSIRPAYDRIGSPQAATVLLGRPDSPVTRPPFGHCDLASSTASVTVVGPLLADWLEGETPSVVAADRQRGHTPLSGPPSIQAS